ncbi:MULTISPECIES: hypothetical protein [Enterococcus]|nr:MULTISPECIES: hypothetical protein [unclassified Enterococcus]
MLIVGVIIGLFIGTPISFFVLALCVAAKRADESMEEPYREKINM